MNIYKQVSKPLPKPGIFISGSRTGREPLPREIRKTIKVESSLDLNLESYPTITTPSGKVTNEMIKELLNQRIRQNNELTSSSPPGRGKSRNQDLNIN